MQGKGDIVSGTVRISFDRMLNDLVRILLKYGFDMERSRRCAGIFASNTLDGVHTHGIDRFSRFIQHIKDGFIRVEAEPKRVHWAGAIEQWDGCLGPGPLNAHFATERALELARENGMGCVALANTNHWMRGGFYGWMAAKSGFVFIGWTNTTPNMPAWGAVDCRLGNNPLVIAVPHDPEAIVLDMAMSQFSYGTVESHQLAGQNLPLPGGFTKDGVLSTNPSEILESRRFLPAGYWKGSSLALLLDLLATILSGGLSTCRISRLESEYAVAQVFIAVDVSKLSNSDRIAETVNEVIKDLHNSVAISDRDEVLYPGERALRARNENLEKGIPIDQAIWEAVQRL